MITQKRQFQTIDLTMGALFVGLMAIGANISVWLPFLKVTFGGTTIPISLQTFFALLAGLLLGSRLGAFSMIAYLLVGATGVPVYSEMSGGVIHLASPTGGFLISFIFVAWVAGFIVEKSKQTASFGTYIAASLTGLAVNYLIGTHYMYASLNWWMDSEISLSAAWSIMVPFLVKDMILTFVVAAISVKMVPRISSIISSRPISSRS
ncbi:biotin transport system substrate-specific component [Melghiribacillus thermohalophilus]|uniref:Biotin transporter n=1 Tax=Melghiribacillus thermohalophilus TaxID=1324956 RepID=A0A4R3MS31_9BACI|nr:biotin transporter BioY [Melghiribacillus thermohalophilus]TCT19064.1 biotin transport system substrate-specific component [Melghiribacillus thermohalophilus]